MVFSRQEYWNGLPFPSLRDLPNPGIKLQSPALQADTLPSEPPGKHLYERRYCMGNKCCGTTASHVSFQMRSPVNRENTLSLYQAKITTYVTDCKAYSLNYISK